MCINRQLYTSKPQLCAPDSRWCTMECKPYSALLWNQAEHGWHPSCNGHHPMLRTSTDRLNIAGICLVMVILPCSASTSADRQEPSWFQCSALPGQLFHPGTFRNALFHRTHYHVSCFNPEHLEMLCFIEHITRSAVSIQNSATPHFIEHYQVSCFNPELYAMPCFIEHITRSAVPIQNTLQCSVS